ncbi:unnamed protein product [Arctogadus glacialis]
MPSTTTDSLIIRAQQRIHQAAMCAHPAIATRERGPAGMPKGRVPAPAPLQPQTATAATTTHPHTGEEVVSTKRRAHLPGPVSCPCLRPPVHCAEVSCCIPTESTSDQGNAEHAFAPRSTETQDSPFTSHFFRLAVDLPAPPARQIIIPRQRFMRMRQGKKEVFLRRVRVPVNQNAVALL